MEKRYKVTGIFEGDTVDETVEAYSVKQAKIRGAFKYGLGGSNVGKFMNSRSIKVKQA